MRPALSCTCCRNWVLPSGFFSRSPSVILTNLSFAGSNDISRMAFCSPSATRLTVTVNGLSDCTCGGVSSASLTLPGKAGIATSACFDVESTAANGLGVASSTILSLAVSALLISIRVRLMTASVPEVNSSIGDSGRMIFRTTRGVISKTTSVFEVESECVEKNRPSRGICPRIGTLLTDFRSSLLISPARICVSPSLSRNTVEALRVPI